MRRNYADITGTRYGFLVAVTPTNKSSSERSKIWKCLCDCGTEVTASARNLRRGYKKSCGCRNPQRVVHLAGRRFGWWTVLRRAPVVHKTEARWVCQCKCGRNAVVSGKALRYGMSKSCKQCIWKRTKPNTGAKCGAYNPRLTAEDRAQYIRKRLNHDMEWSATSKAVMLRDNHTCCDCGKRGGTALVAHHIYVWAEYPELRYRHENCITMCVSCHHEMHRQCGQLMDPEDTEWWFSN